MNKTTRLAAGMTALAILTIALAPLASASNALEPNLPDVHRGSLGPSGDAGCHKQEANGEWQEDCVGLHHNCVGKWGSSGTYTEDSNGTKSYKTTDSYEDTTCA